MNNNKAILAALYSSKAKQHKLYYCLLCLGQCQSDPPLVMIEIMVGGGGNLVALIALICRSRKAEGQSLSDPCDHLLIGVPSFGRNYSCQFLEEDRCGWPHSSCGRENQWCERTPLNLSNPLVIHSTLLSFMLLVRCLDLLVPVARRKRVEIPHI